MANEQIVKGKSYRILSDASQKLWSKISFWTASSDVEFNDGKNAETKVGAIDGITDSLVSDSSNIAASAKAVSELNSNLQSSFQAGVDSVYNAVKAKGTTPASKSLSDVVKGINNISSNLKVVSLGSGGSNSTATFSAKNIPNYNKLTTNNFFIRITSFDWQEGSGGAATSSMSYNSSNGILTIGAGRAQTTGNGAWYTAWANYNVYCVYIE